MWPNWADQGLAYEEQHHRKRKRCQLAFSRVDLHFQLEEVELVLLLHQDGLQLLGLVAALHKHLRQLFDLLMNSTLIDYDNNSADATHVDFDSQMGWHWCKWQRQKCQKFQFVINYSACCC